MDYLSKNIAINLKRIRLGKKMSLDDVSEQTGVSKSMLGQIERGESNPTISTLGKIISGLRVELDSLIQLPPLENFYVHKNTLTPSKEVPGKYSVYTFFPFEINRTFELYVIDLKPNGIYISGSHGENTCEYLTVAKGELTLEVNNERFIVPEGDGFKFDTDKEHKYINLGNTTVSVLSVFKFVK